MLTVTENRDKILVNGSSFVKRLEAVQYGYREDTYGMVAHRCFNVDHITWCRRQLVTNARYPSEYVPSRGEITRAAMGSHLRDIWIRRLGMTHGFKVSLIGYHAVDNTMSLFSFVDCMIQTTDLVANAIFRYASSTEMASIRGNGPYKRDAVAAMMTGYMLHCPDSMVVYGHGRDALFFQTRRVDEVVDSVRAKCRDMSLHLLAGTLPAPCSTGGCRFCHPLGEEAR